MGLRFLTVGLVLSALLNQSLSSVESEEVTVVPRAQEKTYSKVKIKSHVGTFVEVARGLGKAVKQVRSLFFNFMTQIKEPVQEVKQSIREIKKSNYKKSKSSTDAPKSNDTMISKGKPAPTAAKGGSKVELVRDLVLVFREVSGTFVEFFRTIGNPVREFKKGIRDLDYAEEYDEPREYRRTRKRPLLKRKTTLRTVVLRRVARVNVNGTKVVRRRVVKKRKRRVLRKKRVKSDQTAAMEELFTHI